MQEFNAFPWQIKGVSTGTGVFLGEAQLINAPTPPPLMSFGDFEYYYSAPSAELFAAVEEFFYVGGSSLVVVPTAGSTAANLLTALSGTAPAAGAASLLVAPAIPALASEEYLQVAQAMNQWAFDTNGIAVMQLPDEVMPALQAGQLEPALSIAQRLSTSLRAPQNSVLFSTGLHNGQQEAVSTAAVMAGMIAANDTKNGVWTPTAGMGALLYELSPDFVATDTQLMLMSDARINGFLTPPASTNSYVWGALTLSQSMAPEQRYISCVRELQYIYASVSQGLRPFIFQPNYGPTWTEVNTVFSPFLTKLWQAGGLVGEGPDAAFTVRCGVPATMTATDVQNGKMIVQVQVALARPYEFVTLSFTQPVQRS